MFDIEPINRVLERIRLAQQAKSKDVRFTLDEMTAFAATMGQVLLLANVNTRPLTAAEILPTKNQTFSIEGGSMKPRK